jgi:hypothetical protein
MCLQELMGASYKFHNPANQKSCIADGLPYTVGTF